MSERKLVVFWAANDFDGLPATDHHLARALAEHVDVLWVDVPRSVVAGGSLRPQLSEREPGLRVLQVPVPPANSRRGVRQVAELVQRAALATVLARESRRVWATFCLSGRVTLPPAGGGVRVLHVTDDWIAGAPMMGLDAGWMERILRRNVMRAEVVSAVSVDLAQMLQRMNPKHPVNVVPNGATLPSGTPGTEGREPVAVLVGQLNERLDIDLLEGVLDAGVGLRILGPRTDRDPAQGARLDALLAREGVDWRGPVPHTEVSGLLASSAVGLTPYVINDFNRSSFPLKTLEYLAVGLPVVSTPLESLDWLGTDLVDVASGPQAFGAAVRRLVDAGPDAELEQRRRDFAHGHSWQARVAQLLELVGARAQVRA